MEQLVCCYGSLKKGFHNHGLLRGGEFVGRVFIKGSMYLDYNYPRLYKSRENTQVHECELYKVTPSVYHFIQEMERASDYIEEKIKTPYGEASIWYADPEYKPERLILINAYTVDVIKEHFDPFYGTY